MDDADDDYKSRELLAAAGDAELRRLLYGVGGVIPTIGETDHLRLRSLCLQQETREIRGGERMECLANHLTASGGDDFPQVVRQLASERVGGHPRHRLPIPLYATSQGR